MRFFIDAIISTLILSPVAVLSMAVDTPEMSKMTQVKMVNKGTPQQSLMATTPIASSLEKRLCLWNCSKKRKSGYKCKKKFFSSYKIMKAKNAACPKILENKQKNAFPSLHTALKFIIPGPYLEWPIKRNGRFWNRWSKNKYRIVLTKSCKVVGAAIRNKDGSYVKCRRIGHKEDEEDEDKDEDDDE